MATKEQRDELAVFGAIRLDIKALNVVIPHDLIQIVFEFYYVFDPLEIAYSMPSATKWDEFDVHTMNEQMKIEADNLILSRPGGGLSPYSFGTQILNSGVYIWRFKVITPWCWRLGIVDASEVKPNLSHCHTNIKYNYCIQSDTGKYWNKLENGSSAAQQAALFVSDQYEHHVICMMLDWNDKSLHFSVNNSPFKCAANDINTAITYKMACCVACSAKIQLEASAVLS